MSQQVHLPASNYVVAVWAVQRSFRLWHRMDAAFAAMRYPKTRPEMEELQAAHRLMDVAIWRAREALLGRTQRSERRGSG